MITINNSDLPPTDWSSLNARSWPALGLLGCRFPELAGGSLKYCVV